ncbi:MAG: type II toxin-antitoxin system HicB family antitoxin [Candidatus Acidoferrales bacterium]|nr:type II toxin-antitoxin system HicB family antitoxin [Acidobacteriia bacterium AH_259_A11_L15]
MKFRVTLEPDFESGGYVVSCPSLPGCHSQGETQEEALANIREAIHAYLESLKKHNQPIPTEAEVEVDVGA